MQVMRLRMIQGVAVLEMVTGGLQLAKNIYCLSHSTMGFENEGWIVRIPRNLNELLGEFSCRWEIGADNIKRSQSTESRKGLCGGTLLAKKSRSIVRPFHRWGSISLSCNEGCSESAVQGNLLLIALRSVRCGLE